MAGYQIKRMNWTRTMGAYESMQAWRQKRAAVQAKYEANLSNALSALETAAGDQSYGIGELAAKQALKRMSDEAKAKQEKLAAATARDNNQINAPKQSVFSSDSAATLDGGSRVDLASNTLTLSDGTVIDLKTGTKKIDLTV
jgi:hypothetical protein